MMRGGPFGPPVETTLRARPGSGRRTVRRIVGFFRPYRARIAQVVVAILVTVSLGVINPILLKLIIDNLLGPQDLGLLWLQAGLMIGLPIVTAVIGVCQSYLSNVVGQAVMQYLRNSLYRHLQAMPLRFFTDTRTVEIQSRIGNDVNGM